MNFLAHLYLAQPTPTSMLGNILPDLVRGRERRCVHPDLLAGAANHRRVDAFTDRHPRFLASRQRLRERHGIYSGILVDIFYDHLLARQWRRYSDQPFDPFVADAYATLEEALPIAPPAAQRRIANMIEHDWLHAYATPAGIERTLLGLSQRLSQRFAREVRLAHAVQDLTLHDAALAEDFHAFFPQLCGHVGVAVRRRVSHAEESTATSRIAT